MSSINTLKPSGILLLVSLHILISVKGNGQVHAGFTVSSETVCSGSSVIFSDNSDGTTDETIYFWDFGTGALPATANGIGPHIVTYSSPGKSSVSLTVTDDGSSDTKTKTDYITINTLPEVTFSVSLPIQCISSSDYTLTGGLPDGGTYSGAGISGTSFNATIAGLGIHTITYSYIDGNGCTGSAINTIEVIDVPASPDVTVINNCDGTSVLSTTSSGSLLWSTSETTSSITVTSAGVYSVTTTIDGCSSLPGIGTAVPKSIPSTPEVIVVDNCDGTSVLSTNSSGLLLWSTSETTSSITVTLAAVYTVSATVDGCISPQGSGTAAPAYAPLTPEVTVVNNCGNSVLSTSSPGSLLWSTMETTSSITVPAAGVYTVTTTIDRCTSLPGTGTAVPKSIPSTPEVIVVDNCDGTSVLSTNSSGLLLWSTSETTSSITVTLAAVYTVSATVDGCISSPGSGTAAPKTTPSIPVELVDCSLGLDNAIVTVTSPTGSDLQYRLDRGSYSSDNVFTDVVNGSHTITVRNASGCTIVGNTFDVDCGCADPAIVTLSSNIGSTCNTDPITVSGNTFGGSAVLVTITENGAGTVNPSIAMVSPFTFTYTPKKDDVGHTVLITVTTNDPGGKACVKSKEIFTLSVNEIPSAPVLGTLIQPGCFTSTGSVILTGLPSTGIWTLVRSPGEILTTGSGTTATISDLLPDTYSFIVTSQSGCTSGSSANVVIEQQPVFPTPPVVGVISHPTCYVSAGSVILSGLPSNGIWSLIRSPGGVTTTGTGTTATVSNLAPGSYKYTVTNYAGCMSDASSDVVINLQPVTPSAPLVGAITSPTCALPTGSVILAGLPASDTWTLTRLPGTVITTGTGTTIIISGLPYGSYNYTVANREGCLSVPSANILIPVQPVTPSIPVVGAITLPTCTNPKGSVLLTGLPSSGTWTLNRYPDGVTTTGSGISMTISGLSTGTYNFKVTNPDNCSSGLTPDVLIPVQPGIPLVLISDPAAVCFPLQVNLTESAITKGSTENLTFSYWSDAAATIVYLTPASSVAGLYYIKGTSTDGCFDIKPVTVTVTPAPTANAGTGGNECDLTFRFNAVASVGTGTWTKISGPGSAEFASNANSPVATVTVSDYGTYTFKWTEVNGICSASSSIVVNFYQEPTADAGTSENNCGLEFNFNASLNYGVGTWSKLSGPGSVTFSPDAGVANALVTVTAFGSYSFRWTVVNGICSSSATVSINFIQQPPANAGSGGTECDNDFVLNAVIPSGAGSWSMISGPGNALFTPDNNQPDATVTVDKFGSYVFGLMVTNSNCISNDIVSVIFHEKPSINAGKDTVVCKDGDIKLKALGVGSVSWIPSALVSDSYIFDPVATLDSTTAFTVTITDLYGCTNSDEIVVTVREKSVPEPGPDQVLEYQFETMMKAELEHDYETGLWTVISGTAEFADASYPLTSVEKLSPGKNIFLWSVTNGPCPVVSDSVFVTVNDLSLSNLITPNMDGLNDYLILKGLNSLVKTELIIFDRRGVEVYKNRNYDNSWNGVDSKGNPLPDDTYFYVLKTEKDKSVSGFIVIRR